MSAPEDKVRRILEVHQMRIDQLSHIRSELSQLKMRVKRKENIDIAAELDRIIRAADHYI